MFGETGMTGLLWCALCGALPLLVAVWGAEPELGFAAFIGAGSIGAVGGPWTALIMAVFFALLIRYDIRLRDQTRKQSLSVWLGERPTRIHMKAVTPSQTLPAEE